MKEKQISLANFLIVTSLEHGCIFFSVVIRGSRHNRVIVVRVIRFEDNPMKGCCITPCQQLYENLTPL